MNDGRKEQIREIGTPLERPRGNTEAGHRKLIGSPAMVLRVVPYRLLRTSPVYAGIRTTSPKDIQLKSTWFATEVRQRTSSVVG